MPVIRFVTGTDTGIGKTIASAALALAELDAGRSVAYCKPVQTGVTTAEPGDADIVHEMAGIKVTECLRFPAPLAPAVAAELAGTTIDVDRLVGTVLDLAEPVDILLVEGAGGVLVPLAEGVTMVDLARLLSAELVIVTQPSLGTLNHTMLTLEAAAARNVQVGGLIVSMWPDNPGITEQTNLERLAAMAPILGVVPYRIPPEPLLRTVPVTSNPA